MSSQLRCRLSVLSAFTGIILAVCLYCFIFSVVAKADTPPAPVAVSSEFLGNCVKPELRSLFSPEKKAACSAALRAYADLLDEGETATISTVPSSSQGKKHTCEIPGDQLNLCLIAFGAMGDQQEPYRYDVVITGRSVSFDGGKVQVYDLMIMVDGQLCGDKWLRPLIEFGTTTVKARQAVADAASECVQPQAPTHTSR